MEIGNISDSGIKFPEEKETKPNINPPQNPHKSINKSIQENNNIPQIPDNQKSKSKKILIIIGIIIGVLIVGAAVWALWGNYQPFVGEKEIVGSDKGQTQEEIPANSQIFVTYSYTDPETGIEAFSLLIPKGWQADGSIAWAPKVTLPATSNFRFFNPGGSEEFDIMPTQSYYWTSNQLTLATNPPGSEYFSVKVKEPISLHQSFTDIVLPQFRGGVSNLKIIEEKTVPELAEIAKGPPAEGVQAKADGGKIRIEYQENGKTMEEELYAAVSQFVVNMPVGSSSPDYFFNYWYIDYIFSFKAEKGKLDAAAKTFETMIYSVKVNKEWFAKVANVKEQIAQLNIQNIQAVGRMGQMIAQAGSEMRAEQQASWEYRQQASDKVAQNFSDYMLNIDRFNDPFAGKEVELPSGYGNAWANNLGEYIVTDSPSYNPNVGSNLTWQQLEAAK